MKFKEMKYPEYKQLNFQDIDLKILEFWNEEKIFEKSISKNKESESFVFYEGPPSANGMPGIHHVIARSIKDLFCRYKTMKGYKVNRKGGWDTHGLPVELGVEKSLNITKEDIGIKISVEEYNKACREEVMKYKSAWDELTEKMGYWVDLDNPYITFENEYIETLWYLLKQLYEKDLLYKGYTIQPYSPAAGTGLSSHELNLPGCYREVKDTTVVAMFKLKSEEDTYMMAWTTTPWTLPSNTALGVGSGIDYVKLSTINPYTAQKCKVYLAEVLLNKWFDPEMEGFSLDTFKSGDKNVPYEIIGRYKGKELLGLEYEQLIPGPSPENGDAFRVLSGDFVTTEDGTGIVHLAPSFGADDMRVCQQNGIGSLTLVDKSGKFVDDCEFWAGRYVKNFKDDESYENVDIDIVVYLKQNNKAFRVEKYAHTYPHCWRTDKPILYYPLDSWFIKTTAYKDRMAELNKTINWKPTSTGTGRFGNWLENLVDWNLSRTRFWGTPLPIWVTKDREEQKCIGSIEELRKEVLGSVEKGFMKAPLANDFDLHKPYVDKIILVSDSGKPMMREPDLIDVWFDSGAMPYAQLHYPFNKDKGLKNNFPADFIAEGVDQTRGWFFTLHALGVMLFDSVAFKSVVSNGLVLDKQGNKMSKRLGNAVDPFETLDSYGADPTRWYMISNSQPWDNTKFDIEGILETKRKFFGTLYNTYSFFALYANIDGYNGEEEFIEVNQRPEIDQWLISLLNTLIIDVEKAYEDYEPTRAARLIQQFVTDHLSNWYVRLCRRRFWKSEGEGVSREDKIAAYQTLEEGLIKITALMAPIAPFISERIFKDLGAGESVHLSSFPSSDMSLIDSVLEAQMQIAQDVSSLVLGLRKRVNIKVRQPLSKIMVPVLNPGFEANMKKVESLILKETNLKSIEYVSDTEGIIIKKIKPNFKKLGPKFGPKMKLVSNLINQFGQEEIKIIESKGFCDIIIDGEKTSISIEEVDIISEDIPGWLVANKNGLTIALDVNLTEELKNEGIARELINRIQNIRKEQNFNVTDRISLKIEDSDWLKSAINLHKDYICSEILAENLILTEQVTNPLLTDVNNLEVKLEIEKV
jgi:isoleucyl-tRNA synthetase